MRYPFQPDILDAMPEPLAELYRGLEDELLRMICSRLAAAGELNEVTVQAIRALRAQGIDLKDIEKAIQETAGISEKQLEQLLDDVVARNQEYYTDLIDKTGVTAPETLVDASDIDAIRRQTHDAFTNITQSTGFLVDGGRTMLEPAKAYQWALDSAMLQIESGAVSYTTAIASAVRQLADSGIRTAVYESGHTDHIDVAVRRAIQTGISQISGQYTEQSAEYLGTDLFEVSAHIGARDTGSGYENHKAWQGKVYSTTPNHPKYPNIYTVCGLGQGGGLEGWNCRHRRWAFVEGVSERTYTDEDLKQLDRPPFTYQGKQYNAYAATQKQREIERTIRKHKRRQTAYEAAGLKEDATANRARLRRLNAEYKAFSEAAGLPLQQDRLRVLYVDDKTSIIAERALERKANNIAKKWNVPRESVILKKDRTAHITVRNADLPNGLPIAGETRSIVDKVDENGVVLQRRVYDKAGKAAVDFDTTDHGRPDVHTTGAHKHTFQYGKKPKRSGWFPLTEAELEDNKDIIRRGENYHDGA